MSKVFVALAFIAIIVSASLLPEAKTNISSSLSMLQKTRMGKHIITAIQLEMTSKNQENIVVRILALLNELLNEQVASEAQAESDLAAKIEYCGSTSSDYQSQIDSKKQAISDAEAKVPVLENQIQADEASKVVQENKVSDANNSLDDEHEANDAAIAAHAKSIRNHNAMEEALRQARELIVQLKSNSFLQKNDSILIQIQKHNAVSMKLVSEHANSRIFALLMQMAQDVGIQADQELVGNVLNVIDDLLRHEEETVELENGNEASRIVDYNQRVEHLSQIVHDASEEVLRLESEITKNSNDLEATKNNIDQWKQQLHELEVLLEEHNAQCTSDVNNFNKQIEELNHEIDVIRQVIAIFESEAISDIQPLVNNLEF